MRTIMVTRRVGISQSALTAAISAHNTDATAHADGLRPYRVYVALLSQSGTDDPTAIVLENTLGWTPVWVRIGAGVYSTTHTSGFPQDKTFVLLPAFGNSWQIGGEGAIYVQGVSLPSNSAVRVYTTNDPVSGDNNDDILFLHPIEIRVYS